MKKILLVYLAEADFESTATSPDWNSLIACFDMVKIITLLQFGNRRDVIDLIDSGNHRITLVTPQSHDEARNEFIRLFVECTKSKMVYVQVISHGTKDGLILKADNIEVTLQKMIKYDFLETVTEDIAQLHLNLMTVCSSHGGAFNSKRPAFLATTESKSVSTEAITDTFKFLKLTDAHSFDPEKLTDDFNVSENRYHFSSRLSNNGSSLTKSLS